MVTQVLKNLGHHMISPSLCTVYINSLFSSHVRLQCSCILLSMKLATVLHYDFFMLI